MIPITHIYFSHDKTGKEAFNKINKRAKEIYIQLKQQAEQETAMTKILGKEIYDEYLQDLAWNKACTESLYHLQG